MVFSTNFCPIEIDLSGNAVWPQDSVFQKLAELTIFGIWITFIHSKCKSSSLLMCDLFHKGQNSNHHSNFKKATSAIRITFNLKCWDFLWSRNGYQIQSTYVSILELPTYFSLQDDLFFCKSGLLGLPQCHKCLIRNWPFYIN